MNNWELEPKLPNPKWFIMWVFLLILALMGLALALQPIAHASEIINVEKLADAIYRAEGVNSRHPYGILAHYKKTTPRQACINTILHGLKDWNGRGSFIAFLGSRYCPTQGKHLTNDEKRLNIYWIKNVKFFYNKEMSSGQK